MTTIDASSTFSSDPTNAQPVTYVGPVINAPAGAAVFVFATCDAPPSTPTSTIAITAVSGGHTAFELLTINQASFGGANPPITVWSFNANGTPFQVTQQGQNGAQNGQAQAVYVLTDAAGVAGTGNWRGLGTPTISDAGPVNPGTLVLCGFADSPNTLDTMAAALGVTQDLSVVPDSDTIPVFFGHEFVSGAWDVGVAALPNQGGTNGIAVVINSAAQDADADAQTATLSITAPAPTVATATTADAGSISITAPTPAMAVSVNAQVALITMTAPNPTTSSNISSMSTDFGPCEWPLLQCAVWPTGSEAITGNAIAAATEVLWQKTAQRYGVCEMTIRPCKETCGDSWPFFDSWWRWDGGLWPRPLLYNGLWFNIACGGCPGSCSCTVLEQVRLPGPVNTVTQVKINGVVLNPAAYRLDDNQYLVRRDGGRWPPCQNMSLDDTEEDTWSITFTWGEEIPIIGQQALGQLANVLVRECMGEDCKLPRNIQSLVRQGVTIQLPEDWLRGLTFVDLFLNYANPKGLIGAPGIYDPDAQNYRRAGA